MKTIMRLSSESVLFFVSLVAIYTLAWIMQKNTILSWDVSWLIHVSRKLLAGGTYANDFFEINPPLILYLYIPIVKLMQFFSMSSTQATITYVFSLATLSLLLCYSLTQKIFNTDNKLVENSFICAIAIAFLILPIFDLGQRENLLMIFVMPYLLLVCCRLQQQKMNTYYAAFIGLFASLGFALKPHFLIIFILVELYYSMETRKLFSWIRIENCMLFVFSFCYIGLIFAFHHDYLSIIVPHSIHTHYAAVTFPWRNMLSYSPLLFCLLPLLFYGFYYHTHIYKNLCTIIMLATIGGIVSFLSQGSAWHSHILPPFCFSILLLTLLLNTNIDALLAKKSDYLTLGLLSAFAYLLIYFYINYIWTIQLFNPILFYSYFAFLALPILYSSQKTKHFLKALLCTSLIITCGFVFAYVNQFTDWNAHRFSLTVLIFILTFSLFTPSNHITKLRYIILYIFTILMFAFPTYQTFSLYYYSAEIKKNFGNLIAFLQVNAQQKSVYFFSTTVNLEYPFIDYADAKPSSRTADLKWIAAFDTQPEKLSHEQTQNKLFLTQMVIQDINHNKPTYIFVDRSKYKPYLKTIDFDFLKFFTSNTQFNTTWNAYHYVTTIEQKPYYTLQVYKRNN